MAASSMAHRRASGIVVGVDTHKDLVPVHEPVHFGPQQPALSQVLRSGGVPIAE
jgi:hypothetical protein